MAFVIEEARLRGDREAIGAVGRRVHADYRKRAVGGQGQIPPFARIQTAQTPVFNEESAPAVARHNVDPGAVMAKGEHTVLAGPGACRLRCDQITFAVHRCRGSGGQLAGDGELDDRIETLQRLVVGHVFLRLRRRDIGRTILTVSSDTMQLRLTPETDRRRGFVAVILVKT